MKVYCIIEAQEVEDDIVKYGDVVKVFEKETDALHFMIQGGRFKIGDVTYNAPRFEYIEQKIC